MCRLDYTAHSQFTWTALTKTVFVHLLHNQGKNDRIRDRNVSCQCDVDHFNRSDH